MQCRRLRRSILNFSHVRVRTHTRVYSKYAFEAFVHVLALFYAVKTTATKKSLTFEAFENCNQVAFFTRWL